MGWLAARLSSRVVFTDGQICVAIDDLRTLRRTATVETIARWLKTNDLKALEARLLQAVKDGLVWMTATSWPATGTLRAVQFAYYVRRGLTDDDTRMSDDLSGPDFEHYKDRVEKLVRRKGHRIVAASVSPRRFLCYSAHDVGDVTISTGDTLEQIETSMALLPDA